DERELIDLSVLVPGVTRKEPYSWAELRHAINPGPPATLRRTFPQTDFWDLSRHDGEKFMRFLIRALVPLGAGRPVLAESLDPAWRAFVAELLSSAYRESCERALGLSLEDAPLEVSAWRWGPDAGVGPTVGVRRSI